MKQLFLTALAALAMAGSAAGQQKYGIVKYSANYMRTAPDYESGLETQALMGTTAEILDSTGYWLKIKTPAPYIAWATDMGIIRTDSLGLQNYIAAPKYICTALWSEVLSAPKEGSARICDLVAGDLMRIKVNASGKPEKTKYFLRVILPDGKEGYVRNYDVTEFRSWAESRKAVPSNLVSTAKRFVGTPYLWGGFSAKGLDCSGLTRTAFFMNGVLLHRNASQQVKEGIEVSLDGFVPGKSEGNLKPGDLLFFGRKATAESKEKVTHVAMYIGNGCIIHSSHEVRINSLDPAAPDYYSGTPRLLRARRMCDSNGKPYTSTKIIDSPYYFPQDK